MTTAPSQTPHSLTWSLRRHRDEDGGPLVVTPVIDGRKLTDMIEDFGISKGFNDPAGGYGGLIPSFFNYGPLDLYFLGKSHHEPPDQIYVLGCECGEVGCWPLECDVEVNDDFVVWKNFQQALGNQRDYSRFGPFVFALNQYRDKVAELQRVIKGVEDDS